MSKFPYCEKCLNQPQTGTQAQSHFYDYRFDYPVCMRCVEWYHLDPNESES
jgi:hypothetical protein